VFVKAGLFLALLAYFKLRARTAFLASANLTNFSEFGLIVAMIGVTNEWLDSEWLVVLAVALSLSFAIAAALNAMANDLYARHRPLWQRLQRSGRLPDDQPHDIDNATIAIVGMGGVGTGAYDTMSDKYGDQVVGVEIDPITVKNQREMNRKVLLGDPSDADFWDRVQATHTLDLIMLALPKLSTSLEVIEQLKLTSFKGRIAATARFPDEVVALQEAGASTVFNIYTEAGAGYAAHVAASTTPQGAD
ncbi:MAG: NAD-binding protein, partial [Woeseia sp.]